MRRTSLLSPVLPLICCLSTELAAQGTTSLRPRTGSGTWLQLDQLSPVRQSLKSQDQVTLQQTQGLRSELIQGGKELMHLRSKTSLRQITGLPVVRIHLAARLPSLSPSRPRKVGTHLGGAAGAQVWELDHRAPAGSRLRVHLRWRSNLQGIQAPTSLNGQVAVDIGRDGSRELLHRFDGARHLGDHLLTVDSSGQARLAIEIDCQLQSTSGTAASCTGTLDVFLEPVQDFSVGLLPYGLPCGPKQYGVTWAQAGQRRVRLILEGAPSQVPALLALGTSEIEVSLAGFNCPLRLLPNLLVPARTNSLGRLVMDFPAFPDLIGFSLRTQFGVIGSGAQNLLSEALLFRGRKLPGAGLAEADLNHVLGTGQSLSIGGLGGPPLTTSPSKEHWMFRNGLRGGDLRVTGLKESLWETMSSGMTGLVSHLHQTRFNNSSQSPPTRPHRMLISLHGGGGLPYDLLKEGTQPFAQGQAQLALGQLGAWQRQQSYALRCVTNVHGETDHAQVNVGYDRDLLAWQQSYEAAARARGLDHPLPMLHSQMSSYTKYLSTWSFIPPAQLRASVTQPRRLPLVGAKYHLEYLDGIHLTNHGYRHMGEYYGKVYQHVIVEGACWEPLRPVQVSRQGARIVVRFHVPEPPLVLDTNIIKDPGNYGFEYFDTAATAPTITKVSLLDEDQVEILLSAPPSASSIKRLRYAYTGISNAPAGPQTGARGNLRDSDPTPSLHGYKLYNWAVHFDEPLQ